MDNDIKTEFLECACRDSRHLLVFNYDPREGDIWVDVHLDSYSFFKRILIAIKYIFGYKSKYGCFPCWLMSSKEVDKLISFLNQKKNFDDELRKKGSNPL